MIATPNFELERRLAEVERTLRIAEEEMETDVLRLLALCSAALFDHGINVGDAVECRGYDWGMIDRVNFDYFMNHKRRHWSAYRRKNVHPLWDWYPGTVVRVSHHPSTFCYEVRGFTKKGEPRKSTALVHDYRLIRKAADA